MASVNLVIIVGNLGNDPETRYMPSGEAVTNISVATSDRWTDKNSGEKKESTEWHRIVFFGRLAEIAAEYLKKGSPVYVEGKLKTTKYEKDGIDRWSTQIVARSLQMLGQRAPAGDSPSSSSPAETPARASTPASEPAKKPAGKFDDMEDDIPF